MNVNGYDNDNEKQLDEFIDALNADKPASHLTGDAELVELFATARDLHSLRAAEPQTDDVPSRLTAALERELRAKPTHGTRRIESNDMSQFRDTSSDGTLRPPEGTGSTDGLPQRPERARQLVQLALAAVAFVVVGVVLAQIIGGGTGDEPGGAVGTDLEGTVTVEIAAPDATATLLSMTPTPTTWATETPVADSGSALPTPDVSGAYSVLTFEEARELTQFELIEPDPIPQELTLEGIHLTTELDMSTPGSFQAGPVDLVTAYYQNSQSGSVQFWQTTRDCNDPGTVNAVHDDIEVDGRAVRRTLGTNIDGLPLASYRWQSGDVCHTVFAALRDGVDEDILTALVASIPALSIEAEPTWAGPQPTTAPTASEVRAVLSLAPDYVTCDDNVLAYGEDFEPGTTVVIYFGGPIGDNFAPIVEEWPVSEDGTFSLALDHSRFIGECNGGSEEREGNQYKLIAETGTSLTNAGINAEGPSAVAVMTFSRGVPAGVKHRVRLPSCGTEIQRNETILGSGSGPDQAARTCFARAVESGALAEFISYQQTIEDDIVTTIYNSLGKQDVDVIVDGTQDRFGSGTWQRSTCVWGEMSNLEPYAFHFEYCGEPVTIE